MSEFTEVGDRVWVARYEWYDVNVTVVEGEAGPAGRGHPRLPEAGRAVIADLRGSPRARSSGWSTPTSTSTTPSATTRSSRSTAPCPIIAHEAAAADTVAARRAAHSGRRGRRDDPRAEEIAATPSRARGPRRSPRSMSIDLGDRSVELVHPGRGHTGGDLVVRLDDADVLLAGDLVEESGTAGVRRRLLPDGVAALARPGAQLSGPARWWCPATAHRSTRTSCRSSAPRSAWSPRRSATWPVAACPSPRRWTRPSGPIPREQLGDAVRRGYEQLPRAAKRLPLL